MIKSVKRRTVKQDSGPPFFIHTTSRPLARHGLRLKSGHPLRLVTKDRIHLLFGCATFLFQSVGFEIAEKIYVFPYLLWPSVVWVV